MEPRKGEFIHVVQTVTLSTYVPLDSYRHVDNRQMSIEDAIAWEENLPLAESLESFEEGLSSATFIDLGTDFDQGPAEMQGKNQKVVTYCASWPPAGADPAVVEGVERFLADPSTGVVYNREEREAKRKGIQESREAQNDGE